VKGTEVWLLVSDYHAVPRFPGFPNLAWRNVRAQREIVELLESVVAIAIWTGLIPGFAAKVTDAGKSVLGANFGFLGPIIVGKELRALISNEMARPVEILAQLSDILK